MKAYIASSWKNRFAVEMLTDLLRDRGFDVRSFVEHESRYMNGKNSSGEVVNFQKWIDGPAGEDTFNYDTKNAKICDLFIYIGPSGCDAWAEVGIAWGSRKPIIYGLWAKGEPVGLMRRLVSSWFTNHRDLLENIDLVFGTEASK